LYIDGSGADWHEPLLERDDAVVSSRHEIYRPESNYLSLRLRNRSIDRVILAGMSANLCLETHTREIVEQGFEVSGVRDATAGTQLSRPARRALPGIYASRTRTLISW
jgi:nicotinamidase-related amidase